jgi:small subunit ribosomal protein S8
MLAMIKNAIGARMETVDIPYSNLKEQIVKILKDDGFIGRCEVQTKMTKKVIRITLKYRADKTNVITDVKRVSTPGRRVYVEKGAIPKVRSGFGTAILSTSKGLMTDVDARAGKIGGEVLCYVW